MHPYAACHLAALRSRDLIAEAERLHRLRVLRAQRRRRVPGAPAGTVVDLTEAEADQAKAPTPVMSRPTSRV